MSPRRAGTWSPIEAGPDADRLGQAQKHWYEWYAPRCAGLSVLDVGAGEGYGTEILGRSAAAARGIDPAPLSPKIDNASIWGLESESFDCVVACDVIEHVEDDTGFLAQLLRVARQEVFLSTPNWNSSRCANKYHVREYTPGELERLLRWNRCEWYSGNSDLQISRIHHPRLADANFGVVILCA